MKHSLLTLALLVLGVGTASAQNVGIGTTTPGSRLTVNGSFAAGYTAVSTATYTVLDNDYYVVWAGSAPGTFTLPAAAAVNRGRVYKIRNSTALFGLTVNASGGALVDGAASLSITAGSSVELIANGNTSGTAWEVVGIVSSVATSSSAGSSAGTIGGAGGACSPAPTAAGSFVATAPTTSQTLTVTVNISTPGTYTIGTNTVNGLGFFASGYFANTGVQTVPLYASGTPTASGSYAFTVAYGNSRCTTSVTVAPVATFNCAGASQTLSPSGALTNGQAYTGTYTVPYTAGSGLSYPTASQTISGLTLTRTAGTYAAGGGNVVYNLSGTYTGATGGTVTFTTSECGATTTYGDAIRGALAAGGCASCAAYDAAAVNNWIQVTAAEFAAAASTANIVGTGKRGSNDAALATTPTNSSTGTNTYFVAPVLPIPASSYVIGFATTTGPSTGTVTTAKVKIQTTNNTLTGTYQDYGSTLPITTHVANTTYYFIIKRPTVATWAGGNTNYGIYCNTGLLFGVITPGPSPTTAAVVGSVDANSGGSTFTNFTWLQQLLTTTTVQW